MKRSGKFRRRWLSGRRGRTIAAAPSLCNRVVNKGLSPWQDATKSVEQGFRRSMLARIADGAGAAGARRRLANRACNGRRLCLGARSWRAHGCGHMSPMCRSPCSRASIRPRDTLLENTRRFADGLPANNALLWGARGMGKSSLVKAVHAEINRTRKGKTRLALVEIHREEIASLPQLLRMLRQCHTPLPALLRRSFLRQGRHQLQIAEGGAGRRHRRTARQCAVLCHLQPAPPDAARHDGQ